MVARKDINKDGTRLGLNRETILSAGDRVIRVSSIGEFHPDDTQQIHTVGPYWYYETLVFDGADFDDLPRLPGLLWRVDHHGPGAREQCLRQHEAIVQHFVKQLEEP